MKDFFKKFAYTTCFMFGIVFGFLTIPVGYISYELLFGLPIQTLSSQNHTAILRKTKSMLGYRLAVEVDGKQVYQSGKIWGVSETQMRETLVWDKTGKVVAFESMGKIKFAYDADEKREIKEDELTNYCLSPMSEDYTMKNPNCKTG